MSQTETGTKSLHDLAAEYWEALLSNEPVMATSLGIRRFDDRLSDISPSGRNRMKTQYKQMLELCEGVSKAALIENDNLTRIALLEDLKGQIDYISCNLEDWTVDPLSGPQVSFLNIESFQPVRSFEEGKAMIRRWQAIGQYMDDHISNLREGLKQGKVAIRPCVEKVIEELEDLLSRPDSDWPFLRPLLVAHPDWDERERKEFEDGLRKSMSETIRRSFSRYSEFLRSQVLPQSRPQEKPGIVHIPSGYEAYSRLIHVHTSLNLPPDEIHKTGLGEVQRINGEMKELGLKVFGTSDLKELLQRLRNDRSLYFSSRDEVADKAESALARAKTEIPKWFGRLPKADCVVTRMGPHEEKHSTIAYYRQPAIDGSRPGQYYINTSQPETRPRYEAEALAYHESIPGHHLQIAISQELDGIPEFRKHSGVTAFVEGWGLYSEQLADEMALYSSDLDRLGKLSYDSWRACRLVVDTGMHALSWSREQAINFMLENTALAKNNIVNEVDRYITWPGQALAYKTGELEILRLRTMAREKLGARFDIREFHDTLLGNGALPLAALRQVIETFVAEK